MSHAQIVIKKYDTTIMKVSLPENEAISLMEQLSDKQLELAAHEYHRVLQNDREKIDKCFYHIQHKALIDIKNSIDQFNDGLINKRQALLQVEATLTETDHRIEEEVTNVKR